MVFQIVQRSRTNTPKIEKGFEKHNAMTSLTHTLNHKVIHPAYHKKFNRDNV